MRHLRLQFIMVGLLSLATTFVGSRSANQGSDDDRWCGGKPARWPSAWRPGLAGDGDKDPVYTVQSVANMLQEHGITVPPATISSRMWRS
jgi:hypothetical protein